VKRVGERRRDDRVLGARKEDGNLPGEGISSRTVKSGYLAGRGSRRVPAAAQGRRRRTLSLTTKASTVDSEVERNGIFKKRGQSFCGRVFGETTS